MTASGVSMYIGLTPKIHTNRQEEMGIEMDWYLMVWKKYAEFDGRSRRKEFWMFALFNFLAILLLAAIGGIGIAIWQGYGGFLFIPLGIYFLAAIVPALALRVRRLHDAGLSGWWIFIGFVPSIGGLILFIFSVLDSNPGTNQYGPNPKFPDHIPGFIAGAAAYPPMGFNAPPPPAANPTSFGFCKNCGTQMTGASSFCGNCGTHV